MIRLLMILILINGAVFSESPKMGDESAEWLQSVLKKNLPLIREESKEMDLKGKQCHKSFFSFEENTKLYVFISFSVPEGVWIQLSSKFAQKNSLFVIKGIPENSFREFSRKVQSLKKQGFDASICVDPSLFEKFSVEKVPAFVVEKATGFDKIYGSVSPEFVIERLQLR